MSKRYVAFWVLTPIAIAAMVVAIAVVTPVEVVAAAQVVQAVLVGSALVVGATLAAVRFGLFREFEPHVFVEQEVTHRSVSESYVHIACVITLRNTSKVAVRISRAEFSMLMTSQSDDERVESVYEQRWSRESGGDLLWPPLDSFARIWDGDGLIVEPGSVRQETCEFLVHKNIGSVILRSHFETRERRSLSTGWSASTFYDLASTSC